MASAAQLERIACAWEEWAARPDALFFYVNGEALVRVPLGGGESGQGGESSQQPRDPAAAADSAAAPDSAGTPGPGGAAGGAVGAARHAAAASDETRCAHCFVTFATPAELGHHATHHCFPHDPEEVLRRFPVGARAVDTVSFRQLDVVGGASNPNKAHSSVSARDVRRGLVADFPISRLRLV